LSPFFPAFAFVDFEEAVLGKPEQLDDFSQVSGFESVVAADRVCSG